MKNAIFKRDRKRWENSRNVNCGPALICFFIFKQKILRYGDKIKRLSHSSDQTCPMRRQGTAKQCSVFQKQSSS